MLGPLSLDFGNGALFQIDATATITNLRLAGFPSGDLLLNGGTTTIGQGSYNDYIGAGFTVGKEAILNDKSFTPLIFSNNTLVLTIQGEMDVYWGLLAANTLILQDAGIGNCYIDVSGGTLKYWGKQGTTDTLAVPVFVHNGGTFAVSTSSSSAPGGKLIVTGAVQQTQNASVYMTDASSSVQLARQATLECDSDYNQANGSLETLDTTTCTLQDRTDSSGTATISGGSLLIAAGAGIYGELDVNCGNLNFAGSYHPAIKGNTGSPGISDLLKVSGNINLQGSSLAVNVNGQPVGGNTWTIITASNILNDFGTKTSTPQTNLNFTINKLKTVYTVSF